MQDKIKNRIFDSELLFRFSRSSGPGGQHVNKTSTRAELRWDVLHSELLTEEEQAKIMEKLASWMNKEGELLISAQESRSQAENKETAREKFYALLEDCFKPVKKRFKSRPTAASQTKRLDEKKKLSQRKSERKKPDLGE